jgi:hypothetical protein
MQHRANDIALREAWKGRRFVEGPVVPAVPRARGPMGRLGTYAAVRFKTADRVRKGPRHWPHASHWADLARCSRHKPCAPYGPLGRLGVLLSTQGWPRDRTHGAPRCLIPMLDLRPSIHWFSRFADNHKGSPELRINPFGMVHVADHGQHRFLECLAMRKLRIGRDSRKGRNPQIDRALGLDLPIRDQKERLPA